MRLRRFSQGPQRTVDHLNEWAEAIENHQVLPTTGWTKNPQGLMPPRYDAGGEAPPCMFKGTWGDDDTILVSSQGIVTSSQIADGYTGKIEDSGGTLISDPENFTFPVATWDHTGVFLCLEFEPDCVGDGGDPEVFTLEDALLAKVTLLAVDMTVGAPDKTCPACSPDVDGVFYIGPIIETFDDGETNSIWNNLCHSISVRFCKPCSIVPSILG